MAYFYYKTLSKEGRLQSGMIDLPYENPLSAITYLQQQGNTVIFARPLGRVLGMLASFWVSKSEPKVEMEELAEAMTNIAMMLQAGIPLMESLKDAMGGHDNKTIAKMGREIVMRLEGGSSLAGAMKAYPRIFPEAIIFLVRLGEETGKLDVTIEDAASHIQKMDRIKRETKSAMIYPAFMFGAIFGAMLFWAYMVIPPMAELFDEMQMDLPIYTRYVIDGSAWLIDNFVSFFGTLLAVFFIGIPLLKKSRAVRLILHRSMLKMPIFKSILNAYNLALITEYLSLMLKAGVDVMRALTVLKEAIPNEVYRDYLDEVQENLVQGVGLKESFEQVGIFPSYVVRMIGVGEQSGTLNEQLAFISNDYRVKLETLVGNIGKMISPIAILFGGGTFIGLVVAVLTPLYTMIGNM
uniref:Type II secretion system protein, Type 4 fimbrial assembly protein pilC n=1 Tax=Magnetococcus massalia (strain MO-1) TaxID=451514 RepID=A0A1S7LJR1_MAGMO|nr:Type II secretion system protein, Type 4 fimbrial assembly protein pilC [Candidatus Magnetococcus massalia]